MSSEEEIRVDVAVIKKEIEFVKQAVLTHSSNTAEFQRHMRQEVRDIYDKMDNISHGYVKKEHFRMFQMGMVWAIGIITTILLGTLVKAVLL